MPYGGKPGLPLKDRGGQGRRPACATPPDEAGTGVDLTARFVRATPPPITDGGSGGPFHRQLLYRQACGGDFHVDAGGLVHAVVSFPLAEEP